MKRISFLKRKRNIFTSKNIPNDDSDNDSKINSTDSEQDSSSSSCVDLQTYSKLNSNASSIFLNSGIFPVYENQNLNEKIYLIKNNAEFCPIGKGTFRIIYGNIKFFGYEINSDFDMNNYEFDVSEKYQLYSCVNIGKMPTTLNDELLFMNQFKHLKFEIKNFYQLNKDKISLIYFKDVSKNFEILDRNEMMSIKYDYVNLNKYEEKMNSQEIENDKKFLICGKKNSGKSTFALFLINSILSKIKNNQNSKSNQNNKTNSINSINDPYLFLLDCDSGQPLISSPYNVSFIKLNQPIFTNYFNNKSGEIFQSILVEETTPTNNFEDYIKSVNILSETFKQILNNQNHFLIVNTNGYTSGIGNVINSAIIDIIKPHICFYIKNKQSGRLEKGEEFENFILNEEEKNNLNIILRQYKKDNSQINVNLELKSILIENDFILREDRNLKNKNFNKSLYIYSNLIGNEFSLNLNNINKFEDNLNLTKIINMKDLPLVKISFDDIIFSFNFNEFQPKSELDILLSLNGKMCFVIHNKNSTNLNYSKLGNNNIIDFNKIEHKDRLFLCFALVYNIDIIERKVILLSNIVKKLSNNLNEKLILHRNISTLDKNILSSKDSNQIDQILVDKKFDGSLNYFGNKKDDMIDNGSKNYYNFRNKYSII